MMVVLICNRSTRPSNDHFIPRGCAVTSTGAYVHMCTVSVTFVEVSPGTANFVAFVPPLYSFSLRRL